MADINLIPQEVRKEQTKKQVVKTTTIFSIIILIVVVGISAFLFFRAQNLKNQAKVVNDHIESLRSEITSMSKIEIAGRNLDQKYSTVKSILSSRDKYSILMREFKGRVPATITIDTFGTGKENTINISGYGMDYISIAQFVNNLANKNYTGATRGYEDLFSEVELNSVNLDAQTSKARFFIVITFNGDLLKK
ncbi:PilN domain-containing protein [candidate division WWE3 bacterium]|nr:PilN domain-containing protein [candidate division WWE3 bacterium]